jgi:hypothetical protein
MSRSKAVISTGVVVAVFCGLISLADTATSESLAAKKDRATSGEAVASKSPASQIASYPEAGAAERRIQAALDDETTVNFTDTPLEDAVLFLQQQHDIPILLDVLAIEEAGVLVDEPVNMVLADVSLRSAMRLILSQLTLAAVVEDDVLKITTVEVANRVQKTRSYNVSSLIQSPAEEEWSDLTAVVELVGQEHGELQITPVRSVGALVVRTSPAGHQAIVQVLESLRRFVDSRM